MKVYACPWTMIQDSQEQLPFNFENLTISRNHTPVLLNVKVKKLKTADYSIEGLEEQIAVERKSVEDLISTVSHRRDIFKAELERMEKMEFGAVVVEGNWKDCINYCYENTGFNPVSLDNSILKWNQKFKGVHWYFRPDKISAAKTTFKILNSYWGYKNEN